MNKIGKCRVYADHYQFYIYDSKVDPFANLPEWSQETVDRGYIANDHVLHISTRAHLNDHWVELWINNEPPDTSTFDRSFCVTMNIVSGRILIRGPVDMDDDVYGVNISPDIYTVYVLTRNLGVDQFSTDEINKSDDHELTDEEIESRTDLERYKIVFVKKNK